MDEKGVFVWSRGWDGQQLDNIVMEYSGTPCPLGGFYQERLGMVPGRRYRLIAEEAPEPCPDFEPKGEMVVKVLLATNPAECPKGWRSMLFDIEQRLTPPWYERIVGVYRVPRGLRDGTERPATDGIPEVLTRIRDAGGTCLAGEPLPEKAEETWRKIQSRSGGFRCEACGAVVTTHADRCPDCGVLLDGVIPWNPHAYKER